MTSRTLPLNGRKKRPGRQSIWYRGPKAKRRSGCQGKSDQSVISAEALAGAGMRCCGSSLYLSGRWKEFGFSSYIDEKQLENFR